MPFGAQGPPGGGRSDSPQAWYMSLPKVLSRALSPLSPPTPASSLPLDKFGQFGQFTCCLLGYGWLRVGCGRFPCGES